ncbi:hypothetical protein BC628DRAFT_746227 [Trametes gibbosa]|nr:hypothetical protein BC628DRAFT_746227 [Trametes gibbosa]
MTHSLKDRSTAGKPHDMTDPLTADGTHSRRWPPTRRTGRSGTNRRTGRTTRTESGTRTGRTPRETDTGTRHRTNGGAAPRIGTTGSLRSTKTNRAASIALRAHAIVREPPNPADTGGTRRTSPRASSPSPSTAAGASWSRRPRPQSTRTRPRPSTIARTRRSGRARSSLEVRPPPARMAPNRSKLTPRMARLQTSACGRPLRANARAPRTCRSRATARIPGRSLRGAVPAARSTTDAAPTTSTDELRRCDYFDNEEPKAAPVLYASPLPSHSPQTIHTCTSSSVDISCLFSKFTCFVFCALLFLCSMFHVCQCVPCSVAIAISLYY